MSNHNRQPNDVSWNPNFSFESRKMFSRHLFIKGAKNKMNQKSQRKMEIKDCKERSPNKNGNQRGAKTNQAMEPKNVFNHRSLFLKQ